MVTVGAHTLKRSVLAAGASSGAVRAATASKSVSSLPGPTRKSSRSLASRVRRAWKRWSSEDGRRTRVGAMVAAFKMGIYFKVFITLLIAGRFLFSSVQMSFPTSAIDVDAHHSRLRSSTHAPAARVIVVAERGDAHKLSALLRSLSSARYGGAKVDLDVWTFRSSMCNAVPLPLYPLAVVVFGPPRFDHSIDSAVASLRWPHGRKTFVAVKDEPDWARTWIATSGTANETIVFVDATSARAVSPAYYEWLVAARARMGAGTRVNAAVFALDAVGAPGAKPGTGAVLTEAFMPATTVFSPTQDAWSAFLEWHEKQSARWFSRPRIPRALRTSGYDLIKSFRVHPLRAWFSQFLFNFEERVVHPILPGGKALILHTSKPVNGRRRGAGEVWGVHLVSPADLSGLFSGSVDKLPIPEKPKVLKWDASINPYGSAFGIETSGISTQIQLVRLQDVMSAEGATKYLAELDHVVEFSNTRAAGSPLWIMVVSGANANEVLSWLCNVATLGIVPKPLVLFAADARVAARLKKFVAEQPALLKETLVVSLDGALGALQRADDTMTPGSPADLRQLVEHAVLVRDLLGHGVALVQMHNSQIWLEDPQLHLRTAVDLGEQFAFGERVPGTVGGPEMVVAGTEGASIRDSLLFVRPTPATRRLWSEVASRLYREYRESMDVGDESRPGALANWWRGSGESGEAHVVLSELLLGNDKWYRHNMPSVKYASLSGERFVGGAWLDAFGGGGSTHVVLRPAVISNDGLGSEDARAARARRAGMWFWSGRCDGDVVRRAGRQLTRKRSGIATAR